MIRAISLALGALLRAGPAPALDLNSLRLPGNLPAVAAVGEITAGDADRLQGLLPKRKPASTIVLLNSGGGDVDAAQQIAAVVRRQGLAVGVAGGNECSNACLLVFLAAPRRFAGDGARIGLTAPIEPTAASTLQQAIRRVSGDQHMPAEIAARLASFTGGSNVWLSVGELRRLGASLVATQGEPAVAARDNAGPPPPEPPQAAAPNPGESATNRLDHPPDPPSPPAATGRPLAPPAAGGEPGDMSALEAASGAFVTSYMAHWSSDNRTAMNFVAGAYAERVRLYGEMLPQATVWARKAAFAERWPIRNYTARPGSLLTRCQPATQRCEVTATIDWSCRSPDRDAVSVGASTLTFLLVFAGSQPRIEAESGQLLRREISSGGPAADHSDTVATPPTGSFLFDQGLSERRAWEEWLGSVDGDYREGAIYWSGQRSLAHPGSCYRADGQSLGDWTSGCLAAQQRLAVPDTRRRTEEEYRRGWNSY